MPNRFNFSFKDPAIFGGCLSCDLSEGGVRVRVGRFIPLNTELSLKIRLANENIVECVGRVAWVEKIRFGDDYMVGLDISVDEASGKPSKTNLRISISPIVIDFSFEGVEVEFLLLS